MGTRPIDVHAFRGLLPLQVHGDSFSYSFEGADDCIDLCFQDFAEDEGVSIDSASSVQICTYLEDNNYACTEQCGSVGNDARLLMTASCECEVDFQDGEHIEWVFGALYCESDGTCQEAITDLSEILTDVDENVQCGELSFSFSECSDLCVMAYESYTGNSVDETSSEEFCE